jgi:outer membrane protein W
MKIKKLVFGTIIGFLSLLSQQTFAQFEKGDWLVEGSVGNITYSNSDYSYTTSGSTNESNGKSLNVGVYPTFGYFFTNSLSVGVNFGLSFYSAKGEYFNSLGIKTSDYKQNQTGVSFLPFARYYFPGKQTLRFYGQLGAGFATDLSNKYDGSSFNSSGIVTSTYKYDYPKQYFAFQGEAKVGLNCFLSTNVALNGSIGYIYSKSKQSISDTSESGGMTSTSPVTDYETKRSNIGWNLGFTMILPSGGGSKEPK